MLILSANVDIKIVRNRVLIAFCLPIGDKWQSKTLFLTLFDSRSSIVQSVFDCGLSSLMMNIRFSVYRIRYADSTCTEPRCSHTQCMDKDEDLYQTKDVKAHIGFY